MCTCVSMNQSRYVFMDASITASRLVPLMKSMCDDSPATMTVGMPSAVMFDMNISFTCRSITQAYLISEGIQRQGR